MGHYIIRERKDNVAGWVNSVAFRDPQTFFGKLLFKLFPGLYELPATWGAGDAAHCAKKLKHLDTKPTDYKIEA